MSEPAEICVLGSLNVDFVAYTLADTLPLPGQTVKGTLFEKNYGGKGANQAVAAARLGCSVALCGKVGPDAFGSEYLEHLRKNEGVSTESVGEAMDLSTGVAQITVSSAGENCIVIIPGANDDVTEEYAQDALREAISPYTNTTKVLLLQNEIPLQTSMSAMRIAKSINKDIRCIFNPAPAPTDAREMFSELKGKSIDIICPNETELASLTGLPTETESEVEYAARELLNGCQAKAVIVTRGSNGAYLLTNGDGDDGDDDMDENSSMAGDVSRFFPADKVSAVDTTGAGDSFIGTLGANLCRGVALEKSIKNALHCASQSVMDQGAQVSYKHHDDLLPRYRLPPREGAS